MQLDRDQVCPQTCAQAFAPTGARGILQCIKLLRNHLP